MDIYLKKIAFFTLLLQITCFASTAQSLIAGIPSADVVHKGHLEYTHESQVNFWSNPNETKWASFNFLCYGIGNGIELTTSVINLSNKDMNNLATGIGFKKVHQFFEKDSVLSKWETKLTFGQNTFFSMQRPEVGGWVYSHASIRLPKLKTRLTAGVSYGSPLFFDVAWRNENGVMTRSNDAVFCVLAGIEQPITKHFSLIADWYSGRHGIAALITAVQVNIGHQVFIAGYKNLNTTPIEQGSIILETMIHF
jgi:hypothetical protein